MKTNLAIDIQDLCFGYEEREVLHNITLQIPDRDFSIVVGPNGGGKSTLLRLMLGLLVPRYGQVKIFGGDPALHRRDIGYVPQSLAFDPAFPIQAIETVLMGRIDRHRFGGYDDEDRRIAQRCLAEVGLEEVANQPFPALSGGQRQRVMIAQALASEPRILLLDEPGANLDTPGVNAIYELLRQLNERLTIVMVSHNLTMVEAFASHVICVNHTADMHSISEVSTHDLASGNWVHIFHHECPVSQNNDCNLCHTPHHAAPHHESPPHFRPISS